MTPDKTTHQITKEAKSNLAFALACLPKKRRDDLTSFYAFCRVIDDIADEEGIPKEKRILELLRWKDGLLHGFHNPKPVETATCDIRDRHEIPTELFIELIEGCEMDLNPQRFGTWADLQKYTYRVASVVGLISIKLFGCTHDDSEEYALKLGHALQLTNILRDVGADLDNGVRIYLPLSDFARFQYSERDLIGRVHDGRFQAMMNFQADRAEQLFQEAKDSLHPSDREALLSARIMSELYHTLLKKMRQDGFRVFDRRYRIPKVQKLSILAKKLIASKFGA